MPLNVQMRKLLLHPVIDTFIMIKYNSYAITFLTMILMRLLFCLLITGLVVNYPINTDGPLDETTTNNTFITNITNIRILGTNTEGPNKTIESPFSDSMANPSPYLNDYDEASGFSQPSEDDERLLKTNETKKSTNLTTHLRQSSSLNSSSTNSTSRRIGNILAAAGISDQAMNKPVLFWICLSLLAVLTLCLLASSLVALVYELRLRWDKKTKNCLWILADIAGILVYILVFGYLFLLTRDFLTPELKAMVRVTSALLVLASWINFTSSLRFLLLGKFYCLGNYIAMLTHVAKKVAIFFGLYAAVLYGFTLAFHLTMHDEFDNPFGITKTLAMMTGELDFGDTFGDKDKYRQLLLAIFVISVTIVISNLLVGLTVSDVAQLLEQAKMDGMEFKLEQIVNMDNSWVMKGIELVLSCTNYSHMISKQDQHDQEVIWKYSFANK